MTVIGDVTREGCRFYMVLCVIVSVSDVSCVYNYIIVCEGLYTIGFYAFVSEAASVFHRIV